MSIDTRTSLSVRGSSGLRLLTGDILQAYLENDEILRRITEVSQGDDQELTCQRWLIDSAPKRCLYRELYGDLLEASPTRPRVLDVGGGCTALTRLLARHTDYALLEILSHDPVANVRRLEREEKTSFLVEQDWLRHADEAGAYDVIIANDLFPNVDQRLELFLERYLPKCAEVRLSLTYYNTPRWYAVRRLDGEEVFHMLAWDGLRTRRALEPFGDRIDRPAWNVLLENPPSLYSNGRQVCLLRMRGANRPDGEPRQGVTSAPKTDQDRVLR